MDNGEVSLYDPAKILEGSKDPQECADAASARVVLLTDRSHGLLILEPACSRQTDIVAVSAVWLGTRCSQVYLHLEQQKQK